MTAKDRFCSEWKVHFPQFPLPLWTSTWRNNNEQAQQLIGECLKRVTELEDELEREHFTLKFLRSFSERRLSHSFSPPDNLTSEDSYPASGAPSRLVDNGTRGEGVQTDVENDKEFGNESSSFGRSGGYENEMLKRREAERYEETGVTRCSDAHNVQVDVDNDSDRMYKVNDYGDDGDDKSSNGGALRRNGGIRRLSLSPFSQRSPLCNSPLSISISPLTSPKPAPRDRSAFPLSPVEKESNRKQRRSMSTGNIPSVPHFQVLAKKTSVSACSSPSSVSRMKSPSSISEHHDNNEGDESYFHKRSVSKGHRPRSVHIESGAEIRDAFRKKRLSGSHSDSSLFSSISSEPILEGRGTNGQDRHVVLELPENAIPTSPSEDIFSRTPAYNEDWSEKTNERQNISGKELLPTNLVSPEYLHEVTRRAVNMSNRESSFLDSSDTDSAVTREDIVYNLYDNIHAVLSCQNSNQSVELDEVSLAIYDDCDNDDFLDSDEREGYLSSSEYDEDKNENVFRENGTVEHELAKPDDAEKEVAANTPALDIHTQDDKDEIYDPLHHEPVLRRKKQVAPPSPRRDAGISFHNWKEVGDLQQDPQLAHFYHSQLQTQNKENETQKGGSELDGEPVYAIPLTPRTRISNSPSLSPQVRTPSPTSRRPSDEANNLALRKMIVSTFLDKEQDYVDQLNLVCQHYHKPLAALATTSQPMLSIKDCDIVFYKQEDLFHIHQQLVRAIESRLSHWSSQQTVADCFGILVDALPLYKSYFENYQAAVELVMRRKTELPQFAYLVDSAAQMKSVRHRVPLEELLRKPVDKLQNYSLVLKDLLKYTPRDHQDFDLLYRTSQSVTDLLKSINRGPAETEGKRPLKSEVVVQLTESGRKFRQLCLFEDVLVCVKQKGSGRQRKYECKWYLPLTELTFHPPPDADVPGPIPLTSHQELEALQGKIGKLKYEMHQEQSDKKKLSKLTPVKSSSKLDKLRKKLLELEASLRLNKAGLPLRLFDVEGRAYTLLFCQESQRCGWQDGIAKTRETAKPVQISPYDLEALIRRSRRALRRSDSIRSIQIEADVEEEYLSGILHIQVHSAKGVMPARQGKPDLFCTLSVDCYGRFDKKAKTHVVKESVAPGWEQDFDIEVEGTQSVKITCCDRRNLLMEDVCGRGQLELLKLGVKDGKRHVVDVKLMPKGTVKVSVMYSTGLQSLSRKRSMSESGLFGVPIALLCHREKRKVPHIVTCCCEEIERRGLVEVGIYRISGVTSDVRSLKQAFEQGADEGARVAADIDIHAVSGLVKMFFRELPEPLFTNELYPRFVDGLALGEPEAKKRFMASLVQSLPPVNLETILYLFRHLRRVVSEEKVNKMSFNNLSTVFGPNLLRPATIGSDYAAIAAMSHVGILLYLLQLPEELLLTPPTPTRTHAQFSTIAEEP